MDKEVVGSEAGGFAFRVAVGAAIAGLVAYSAHALFAPALSNLFDPWMLNGVASIAFVLCAVRAVRVRIERLVWIAMSVAIGSWVIGSSIMALPGGTDGALAEAGDLLRLVFAPAGAIALGFLVRSRMRPFLPSTLLDGLIVALAAAAVGSVLISLALGSGHNVQDMGLRLSMPLGDLMLLVFLGWVLAMIGWRAGRVWDLIAGGLALVGFASAVYVIHMATHGYVVGSLFAMMWPAGMLLIAVAAWQAPEPPVKPRVKNYSKLLVASAAATTALLLMVVDHFAGLDPYTVLLATATLVAVIVRAAVTFKESMQMVADFRHQAQTDSLTGLGNRRKLMTDLSKELAAATIASPRVLVIYDLDGFKQYNDTYGHPAGDALLHRLGGNLARAIGPYGHGYRLGGDEFCVLVTHGGPSAKTIIALASAALTEQGEGFGVTASYGAVILPHEAREPALALRIADQRMYTQKEDRRSSATSQTRDILMQVLHEREPELGTHMMDVARLARGVGARMALLAEELDEVVRAAELHDIGKMAIPDEILHKPAALDDQEWEFIRQHTVVGERILEAAPSLLPVAKLVRASHERWDGSGYPDQLAGEGIPLGARIVSACDAFDAMITARPYRGAMQAEEALGELRENSGTQFDPDVVEAVCQEVHTNGYRLETRELAA